MVGDGQSYLESHMWLLSERPAGYLSPQSLDVSNCVVRMQHFYRGVAVRTSCISMCGEEGPAVPGTQ